MSLEANAIIRLEELGVKTPPVRRVGIVCIHLCPPACPACSINCNFTPLQVACVKTPGYYGPGMQHMAPSTEQTSYICQHQEISSFKLSTKVANSTFKDSEAPRKKACAHLGIAQIGGMGG